MIKLFLAHLHAQKHRYVGGSLTEDDRYLIISASTSTSGNKLFIQDLTKKNSALIPIVNNFDSDTYVIDNRGTTLYLVTNLNAPNQKIVTVDATDPAPKNWKDFIPETAHVLKCFFWRRLFFH
jgi:prolyl oligopeptidase